MALNTPFFPYATTNAPNSFSVRSGGYVQGVYQDDPANRYQLMTGTLSANSAGPIWGGMPISESLAPSTNYNRTLGGTVAQATTVTNITGFSVFNNAYAYPGSPSSPVPIAGATGMTVAFFRMGCGIQIPVAMDASLVSLNGGLITQQVSWDFNNQCLQPYDASTATVSLTSITSSYANGVYTFAVVASAATNVGAVGDFINVSGVTSTGAALVNGNQTVTAYTDSQHFSFQVTAASGAIATGTLSGTLVLNQGTGALNVKIVDMDVVGNSMTVNYNAATGAATWNRQAYAALIQI
jgi:hypothetical protein